MAEFDLTFWHWLILGVGLIVLELLLPGVYLLWLGIAALLTGIATAVPNLLAMLYPDESWKFQAVTFAVLSIVSVIGGHSLYRRHRPETDHPILNRPRLRHVGKVLTLDSAIADGVGQVRIDDSVWRVTGPDLAAGVRVRVVDVDGVQLVVEATDPEPR